MWFLWNLQQNEFEVILTLTFYFIFHIISMLCSRSCTVWHLHLSSNVSYNVCCQTFTWSKTAQVEQENWFYAVGLLIRVFKHSVALKSLSCACGHFKCWWDETAGTRRTKSERFYLPCSSWDHQTAGSSASAAPTAGPAHHTHTSIHLWLALLRNCMNHVAFLIGQQVNWKWAYSSF